jgi:hypothetical protein
MALIRYYIEPVKDGWKVTTRRKRVLRAPDRGIVIGAAVAAAQQSASQGHDAEVHIDEGRSSLRQIWPMPRRPAEPWRLTLVATDTSKLRRR